MDSDQNIHRNDAVRNSDILSLNNAIIIEYINMKRDNNNGFKKLLRKYGVTKSHEVCNIDKMKRSINILINTSLAFYINS